MEENTVLREDVLAEAIKILEIEGIANTSLEMVAERVSCPTSDLKRFWPDREALLYDALRYLSQQVDAWRRQLLLDETLSAEQKPVSYTHLPAAGRGADDPRPGVPCLQCAA